MTGIEQATGVNLDSSVNPLLSLEQPKIFPANPDLEGYFKKPFALQTLVRNGFNSEHKSNIPGGHIVSVPNLECPSTLLQEGLLQMLQQKFQRYEDKVLKVVASELCSLDPKSEVLVAGSYKNSPSELRPSSDIDVIVLSKVLASNNKLFKEFMIRISSLSTELYMEDGLSPVFFTRVQLEQHMVFTALNSSSPIVPRSMREADPYYNKPGDSALAKLVPVHFLFYEDRNQLRNREPEILGSRILKSAHRLIGSPQEDPLDSLRRTPLNELENSAWDVERIISETVLNMGWLSSGLLIFTTADKLYNVVRGLSDSMIQQDKTMSVHETLQFLGDTELLHSFSIIENIRKGIAQQFTVETLIDVGFELLDSLKRAAK